MTVDRNQRHVLVVEDDARISALLRDYLSAEGYTPTCLADGRDVQRLLRKQSFCAVLLDVSLPGNDGYTLCQQIRVVSAVPILFLTAKIEDADRLRGFDVGADDYVCKPFSPREVMARVHALVRRAEGIEPSIAASIVFMALDNLIRPNSPRLHRIALIFLCGLLHGLGFASSIADMGLDTTHRILSLLGFNTGIEIGQFLFLSSLALSIFIVRRFIRLVPSGRKLAAFSIPRLASATACIFGLVMFIERVRVRLVAVQLLRESYEALQIMK